MEALLQIHSCFFSHSMKQLLLRGHAPPKFLEKVVIFRFERRYLQKYICCSPKIKHFGPSKFFGPPKQFELATPLSHCIAASPVKDARGQQSHAENRINYRKS